MNAHKLYKHIDIRFEQQQVMENNNNGQIPFVSKPKSKIVHFFSGWLELPIVSFDWSMMGFLLATCQQVGN